MFDNDNALIRVDMSEYMERHAVSKIIGAPPGYVGHEESGSLTETVRHRPYSVILFDEIEKAHPEVFNILLQILDDGRLTDAKGRTVNFKNTIIILTSNVGSMYIDKMQKIGFSSDKKGEDDQYGEMKEKVIEALKESFRPEFLNRLDEVIIFNILSRKAIEKIVDIQVNEVKKRLLSKDIKLEIAKGVKEYLSEEGYDPSFGARPLKRLIQSKILNPVASMMITNNMMSGGEVAVGIKGKEFTFEMSKKGKKRVSKALKKPVARKKKALAI
jgi:ATP-dependent Clp protease ATP-binding subunit ClpC